MKYLLLFLFLLISTFSFSQTQELNGVTFGFGAGYSLLSKRPYSYSLSTDTMHSLQTQKLSKGSFVISSVITIKLGKVAIEKDDTGGEKTEKLVNLKKKVADAAGGIKQIKSGGDKHEPINFWNRLSINLALNLVEISSDNIAFNKSIDGGLGVGCFINEYLQVALFYDIIRTRQLQDHILTKYENKRIPNGNDYFNALDQNDNNLFYNKTFTGFSFKVIFSLANKKPATN